MIQLFDTSYQNARPTLIEHIDNEQTGIDVAMWFMEDLRISTALIRAHRRGVPVRVLMNRRDRVPAQMAPLEQMKAAGIPMRASLNFFHPKAMIFTGQQVLQIGGANFTGDAWHPETPYVNYIDEVIGFLSEPRFLQPAMREFDDAWTTPSECCEYCNAPDQGLQRLHGDCTPSGDAFLTRTNFYERLMTLIAIENDAIDIIMYRLTNADLWHQLHLAQERGIRVRLISEPNSYYKWQQQTYMAPFNLVEGIYYMHALGGQIKHRVHAGLTHEKFGLFYSTQRMLYGSQNWCTNEWGHEWNVDIYGDETAFKWGTQHFDRKWEAPAEFAPIDRILPLG